MSDRQRFVSVVSALPSEASRIEPAARALAAGLGESFDDYEIILVAASSDVAARASVVSLLASIPNVHVFVLGNRPDRDLALTAGLDHAIGDIVVTIELGFDPPEAVVRSAQIVASDVDVVYGVDRSKRYGRVYERLASVWRRYFESRTGVDVPDVDFGLRAVSRRVLNTWLGSHDRERLIRVMPAMSGYPWQILEYDAGRSGTASRQSLARSVATGLRTLMNATPSVLRVATALALVASLLNVLYAIFVVSVAIIRGDVVEGWVSLSLQTAGMFFLISLVLAIISEYLYQVVQRTNERPIYRVVDERTSSEVGVMGRLNVETAASPAGGHAAPDGRGLQEQPRSCDE